MTPNYRPIRPRLSPSRLTRGRIPTDTGRTVALTSPPANRVHPVMELEAGDSGGRSTLDAAMYG